MFVSNNSNGTLISGTSGSDRLSNYGSSVTMEGNAGDDELVSFSAGSYVSISGGSGDDTIHSWSPNTLMLGNEGKNYLYAGADYATVLGGVGDDEIITYGKHSLIYGYEGNDVINVTNIGDYATVIGAEGDDIISIPGGGTDYNEIWYFDGDGDDVVIGGFGARDTLSVVDVTYTVSDDRNDLVVKAGSGSIRFKKSFSTVTHLAGCPLPRQDMLLPRRWACSGSQPRTPVQGHATRNCCRYGSCRYAVRRIWNNSPSQDSSGIGRCISQSLPS